MAVAKYILPTDSGRKNALAFGLAHQLVKSGSDIVHVQTEFGIWPSSENDHLFSKYRAAFGEARQVFESPFHLLESSEEEVVATLMGLSLYFVQGCVSIRADGTLGVVISHDEFLGICGSSLDEVGACRDLCKSFQLPVI